MTDGKRFAIIRLSAIGDVLHATPVARALKTKFPACHITWIVGQASYPMVKDNPFIDEVYIWSRERWETMMRQGKWIEAWRMWRQLRQDMAARRFDIALDVHGLLLSGMVTKVTGAPRRIGLGDTKEPNWLFMTERSPSQPQEVHAIQRYLSILRPLGITTHDYKMTLCLDEQAKRYAEEFFTRHAIRKNEKVVVLNPATTWPAKNWPAEFFAAAADALARNARIIVCGGPGDIEIVNKVMARSAAPVINAVGQTSLQQLAAIIGRANLVIAGDTGPLHMAVALGVPTVSIFGPTDPARFGPLSPGHIVLRSKAGCMPCHKTVCPRKSMLCMNDIRPDAVIAAARRVLAGDNGGQIKRPPISFSQR